MRFTKILSLLRLLRLSRLISYIHQWGGGERLRMGRRGAAAGVSPGLVGLGHRGQGGVSGVVMGWNWAGM